MATKFKKFLKSFTLIELIIVIAIIAVLGATAFLVLSQWMSKSRDSRKITDLGTIDTAINISITSNDKIPKPDNLTKVMYSGNRIWDVGYFGDEAVKQIGGSITKIPIDPTTKERYRYAQWANKKYQLGTIIENQQFSKYANRTYAQSYFIRLQGNYNQTIIVASIDGVDTILPVPSLIVDKYEGEGKNLNEEHFWTNKGTYNLGGDQPSKLKVEALFSGDFSKLSDTTSNEFNQYITNFEKVYTGTNFVNVLNNKSEDEVILAIAQELSKVSSQPVSVQFLGCEGYNHGAKVDFYKQESVGFGDSCDSIKSQFECKNGVWAGSQNKTEYTKSSCNAQLPAQCDGNDHGTVKDFFSADSVAFGQTCVPNLKSFTCENGTWKDGGSNADISTYQYTSCVVGNPVDCNASNIVKKSVTNLDITFDITATLHGLSFEKAKTVTENNGSYEYTLVGDCSNGIYQEVTLSDPVNKGCDTGYDQIGNSCEPKNCDATTQTVNSHTYTVGAINHGGSSTVTSNSITISNGEITYNQSFQCNLGIITTSGTESTNTPTCNSGYSPSGTSCEINTYTVSGGFGANANGATINVCGSNVTALADGTFTTTRNHGSVCNNITATRTGYTCSTSTNGPASLTANATNIAGSCTQNIYGISGNDIDGRTFADGTYGSSCNSYKNPSSGYVYSGSLGSGIYWIDPDGAGIINPFKVYCDMTTEGGGWTLLLASGLAFDRNSNFWNGSSNSNVSYTYSGFTFNSRENETMFKSLAFTDSYFNWWNAVSIYRSSATSTFLHKKTNSTPWSFLSGSVNSTLQWYATDRDGHTYGDFLLGLRTGGASFGDYVHFFIGGNVWASTSYNTCYYVGSTMGMGRTQHRGAYSGFNSGYNNNGSCTTSNPTGSLTMFVR